jgi:hypothetical protein
VAAGVAPRACEALAEDAAIQVGAQLSLNVPRKAALVVLARVREKRFEVLADEFVKDGFRWAARRWTRGTWVLGAAPCRRRRRLSG